MFQTVLPSVEVVSGLVVSDARACLSTWRRVKRCSRNLVPCSNWNIASGIFFFSTLVLCVEFLLYL